MKDIWHSLPVEIRDHIFDEISCLPDLREYDIRPIKEREDRHLWANICDYQLVSRSWELGMKYATRRNNRVLDILNVAPEPFAFKTLQDYLCKYKKQEGASVSGTDSPLELSKLLMLATMRDKVSCMALLLDNGADQLDAYIYDFYIWGPGGIMCEAVLNRSLEATKLLVHHRGPVDALAKSYHPVGLAAVNGRCLDIMEVLLDAGADTAFTALHYYGSFAPFEIAARQKDGGAMVKLLLDYGLNPVDRVYNGGSNPLLNTIRHGNIEAVEVLLDKGVVLGNDAHDSDDTADDEDDEYELLDYALTLAPPETRKLLEERGLWERISPRSKE